MENIKAEHIHRAEEMKSTLRLGFSRAPSSKVRTPKRMANHPQRNVIDRERRHPLRKKCPGL